MVKIHSPKDLADFIKIYSPEKVRKSISVYDDSVVIRLYTMIPVSHRMVEYEITFSKTTRPLVVEKVERLYHNLPIPKMNYKEIEVWNAHVPSNMKIKED